MRASRVLSFMYHAIALGSAAIPYASATTANNSDDATCDMPCATPAYSTMLDIMHESSAEHVATKPTLSQLAKNVYDEFILYDLIQVGLTTDINAPDANGKTPLNLVVESLYTDITTFNTKETALKIQSIDFLLANGANRKVLETIPETKAVITRLRNIYKDLLRKWRNLSADKSPDQAFYQILTAADRHWLLTYHALQMLLGFANKIDILQQACNKKINAASSKVKLKPLIIADVHSDKGAHIFLEQMAPRLRANKMNTFCIEQCREHTFKELIEGYEIEKQAHAEHKRKYSPSLSNLLDILRALKKHKFDVKLIDIIPCTTFFDVKEDPFSYLINFDLLTIFGHMFHFHLRDKGMQLLSLPEIIDTDGNIAVQMGGAHVPGLLKFLAANGIEAVPILPVTNEYIAHQVQLTKGHRTMNISALDAVKNTPGLIKIYTSDEGDFSNEQLDFVLKQIGLNPSQKDGSFSKKTP